METEVLVSLLGVFGLVIVALIGALFRQRRNNHLSNPGPSCKAQDIWEKHSSYQDAMTRKLDQLLQEFTRMRTIIEERLPRGG